VTVYCNQEDVSQCFTAKAWLTANELLGLPSNKKIGVVTHQLAYEEGVKSASTCGHFND